MGRAVVGGSPTGDDLGMQTATPWRVGTAFFATTTLVLLGHIAMRRPATAAPPPTAPPAVTPAVPHERVHVAAERSAVTERVADAPRHAPEGSDALAQQRELLDGLSTDEVLVRFVISPPEERPTHVSVDVVIARLARDRAAVVRRMESWLDDWRDLFEAGVPLTPEVFEVFGALAGKDGIPRLRVFGPEADDVVGSRLGAVRGLVRAGDREVLTLIEPRRRQAAGGAPVEFVAAAIPGTPGIELLRELALELPTGAWREHAARLLWSYGDDADRERLLTELPPRALLSSLGGAVHERGTKHATALRQRVEQALEDTDVYVRLLAERVLLPPPDTVVDVTPRMLERALRDIELGPPASCSADEFAAAVARVRERVSYATWRAERDATRRRVLGLE